MKIFKNKYLLIMYAAFFTYSINSFAQQILLQCIVTSKVSTEVSTSDEVRFLIVSDEDILELQYVIMDVKTGASRAQGRPGVQREFGYLNPVTDVYYHKDNSMIDISSISGGRYVHIKKGEEEPAELPKDKRPNWILMRRREVVGYQKMSKIFLSSAEGRWLLAPEAPVTGNNWELMERNIKWPYLRDDSGPNDNGMRTRNLFCTPELPTFKEDALKKFKLEMIKIDNAKEGKEDGK
jgi:hypothetical protein